MFTWKSHAGLKFHFGQNERYEIYTVLSFILPQFMWTQVKSWQNTEVRFSTEMKSYTSLSSFRSHVNLLQKVFLYIIAVTAWISALVQSWQIWLICLYILPCLIIFQVLVEAILSKSSNENIESLFTLVQSVDRNINFKITESTSNMKFKTRHFWKSTTNIKKYPTF